MVLNTIKLRTLYMYNISHDIMIKPLPIKHVPTAKELADDQLPAGHTPVWIEPPGGATQVQMLERVETMAGQYQDVMVLHYVDRSERAAAWCEEKGWHYQSPANIFGCEAQCVVLLQCNLRTEFLTRTRNMLIIFNKDG